MLDGKSEGGKKKEKGTRNKREKTNRYESISVFYLWMLAMRKELIKTERIAVAASSVWRFEGRIARSFFLSQRFRFRNALLIFVYPLKQNNFFFLDWTKRFASVYQICVKNWLFEPVIKIYKIRFVDLSELPIYVKYTVYVYCIPAENFVEIDRRCYELQTVKNGQFLTNFGLSLFTIDVSQWFRWDFHYVYR